LLQWTEWISPAGLGSGNVLPATGAADYHLGDYDATKGVFINPQEKTSLNGWPSAELKLAFNDKDPKARPGGSIGDVIYFSNIPGLFESTGTITVDSTVIMKQVDSKKKDYEKYE